MTNKKSQKNQLAKLMATENLTIVHKKVPTAYFDMKNRILCCPIFKDDLSNELYDLFMGHEVGHALNTPYEGVHSALTKNRTLKGYLNVVEDVRIEKAIKNKYPGLRKSFYTAYNELMEMDFFGIAKRDVNALSLIDKINLITKVGARVNITLSKEEAGFLQMAEDCVTWEDVEECANAIYDWSKENETRNELDESIVPQTLMIENDEEEGEEEDGDDFDSMPHADDEKDEDGTWDSLPDLEGSEGGSEDGDEETEEGEDESGSAGKESDESPEEAPERKYTGKEGGEFKGEYDDEEGARESITEHNAHNNEEMFISEDNIISSTVLLKDKFKEKDNFKDIVVPYKTMISEFDNYFTKDKDSYSKSQEELDKELVKAKWSSKKLRDKNKKIVSHMAKEFEMKQTAMRSKHAFQGKTGKLDMNRLAKYQIVDDIFKKVTYIPDGKNHGLQILLDWSGSICNEAADLIEQTMVLVDFCRKVQIPHRVYLFSDAYRAEGDKNEESYWGGYTKLIEVFSDKQGTNDYVKAHTYLSQIWNQFTFENYNYRSFMKVVEAHNNWFGEIEHIEYDGSGWYDMPRYGTPNGYRLGGTPLDHCLLAMRCLIPEFNKEYGIEKSIMTVITDGFSHNSNIMDTSESEREEVNEQQSDDDYYWRAHRKRFLIDPFTHKSYLYHDSNAENVSFDQTQNLLEWLSAETGVIVTGYFVLGRKQDLHGLARCLPYFDVSVAWRQIRKEGICKNVKGYNKLFLTSSNALGVSGDSELDDELVGATKRKLLGAFKKNQSSKTTSRFLTNEFIKEIA